MGVALVAMFIFASCKDKGPELTPSEQILTSKVWKLKSITVPQITDPSKDSSIAKECTETALFAFDRQHTFNVTDVAGNCDSTIIPYGSGSWQMFSTDSLYLSRKAYSQAWKLKTLNDSVVVAVFKDSIAPNSVWIKTLTLNK